MDIVEQLRKIAKKAASNTNYARASYCAGRAGCDDIRDIRTQPSEFLEWKAAAEIERLRERNEHLENRQRQESEFYAEIERLRTELAQARTLILAARDYVAGSGCATDWARDSWLGDADNFVVGNEQTVQEAKE